MDIIISGHDFRFDITSMSMLFFPGQKVNYVDKSNNEIYIKSTLNISFDKQISVTKVKLFNKTFRSQRTLPISENSKDLVKYTFYMACRKATSIESSWGTLTGIRPLSVFERLKKDGDNYKEKIKRKYLLSDDKIEILGRISAVQSDCNTKCNRDVSIYISIPFCPSKCTYCSFISISAVNKEQLLRGYLSLLKEEISLKSKLIHRFSLNVKSLYIGGGTPGVLSLEQLEELLKSLDRAFMLSNIDEKSFEIGRPDTVTDDKLKMLNDFGFERICINTQTTCDDILNKINRNHSSYDYFNAIDLAFKYNFKCINTDLIAGLPGESVSSFEKSIDDVTSTGVNNITVHTLSIKKSSVLSQTDDYYDPSDFRVNKMLEYAYKKLDDDGFIPYYIYRQKNCVSNGENVGFCKHNTPCKYNIYMMEDVHSVIACGAGASSKIVNGTSVWRSINVKYPMEYVSDFEKIRNNTLKIENELKAMFF